MRYAHVAGTLAADRGPLVAVEHGRVVPLAGVLADVRTLDDLIAAGPEAWARARAATLNFADGYALQALDEIDLSAPLARPSKVVCIGLNYHDHAAEQGVELPERPLVFAKFPSTLCGHEATVSWSSDVTSQVDWEAELAVVVGRRLREAGPDEAIGAVFGYTVANDISARDVQFADGQWVRGKSLDGFLPLGPVVVSADEFGDPAGHAIRARINGQTVQDSNTSDLIFGVSEILSFLSYNFTLEPGDLVLTGTPAGVGAFRRPPIWLTPGDRVEVEVEGIGTLRSHVVGHVPKRRVETATAATAETPG